MRVIVTGHHGYIGSVLVPVLQKEGHHVAGIDSGLFSQSALGENPPAIPEIGKDIRDVNAEDLAGFDAVIHLAGISNDPLGDLKPECTYEVNHLASTRLARLAREAGVSRFLFASSCSSYGASSADDILDETAAFQPVTPYAESKILVEQDLHHLADENFSPTYLRCATAYGYSPRFRADLVVNNLSGYAFLEGKVFLKSDGTSWRPLVHILDIAEAYRVLLTAPKKLVHDEAFNVGRTSENFQVRDVANIVHEQYPDSRVEFAENAGADKRCYRVSFEKLENTFPIFRPQWTVGKGVSEIKSAYAAFGLTPDTFDGPEFQRIKRIRQLQASGDLDASMRWTNDAVGCASDAPALPRSYSGGE